MSGVGKARKAQTAGDLWHLSIDDLLMPTGSAPQPAGSGPFVLNLSTSTATIPPPPASLPQFEGLRVYLLERKQEGRAQFRLRLGIIESALQADAILAAVREHYPGATLESATDDDESVVAAAVAKASAEAAICETGLTIELPGPVDAFGKAGDSKSAPADDAAQSRAADSEQAKAVKAPKSLLPDVPIEPVQNVRWDIDDLLPDLPVTRPSRSDSERSERPAGRATPPNARGASAQAAKSALAVPADPHMPAPMAECRRIK